MSSTLLRAIVVAASLLLSSAVLAQSGEDVLRFGERDAGFSARTLGLAGASVGGIGDWGAAASNPASLALVRRSHVTGSLDLSATVSDSHFGRPMTARTTRVMPGHVAYIAPLPVQRGSFVTGVGFHRTTSLDRRLFFEGADSDLRWGQLYESGWLGELSGVAAIEVVPRLFMGVSLNAVVGEYAFTEYLGESRAVVDTWFLESELRGFNVRAGLIGEPTPGFRFGLSVESPTWLHADESFGELHAGPARNRYAMQSPWRISTGGVYRFEDVTISTDIILATWSQARLRPSNVFAAENQEIRQIFQETVDARLGVEYDFGLGAVRGGYSITQDPLRDEVQANRTRHTFASGLSYYFRRGITVDLGLAYTAFDDQLFFDGERITETVGRFRGLLGIQYNI